MFFFDLNFTKNYFISTFNHYRMVITSKLLWTNLFTHVMLMNAINAIYFIVVLKIIEYKKKKM
jgi:hypothetical protein